MKISDEIVQEFGSLLPFKATQGLKYSEIEKALSAVLPKLMVKDGTLINEGTKAVDVAADELSGNSRQLKSIDVAAVRRQVLEEVVTLVNYHITDDDDRSALRAAIRALSAEPAQGEQWHPIETAPKDGSYFLAYFPLYGLDKDWCRVVPVYLNRDGEYIFASRAASGFSRDYQPTHWMPLPTAPTSEAGR